MELTFPAAQLSNTKLVVFESLYYRDSEIALHADLANEDQTVTYRTPEEPEEPASPEPEEPEEPETPIEPQEPSEDEAEEPEEFVTEVKQKPRTVARLSQTGDIAAPLIAGLAFTATAATIFVLVGYRRHRKRQRAHPDLLRGGRR